MNRFTGSVCVMALLLASCGNPRFNVKYTNDEPDLTDIATRIQCEIADMFRIITEQKRARLQPPIRSFSATTRWPRP